MAREPSTAVGDPELPGLLTALHDHHDRTAQLLGGLDELRQVATDANALTGTGLLADLTERLREADRRLQHLAGRLESP